MAPTDFREIVELGKEGDVEFCSIYLRRSSFSTTYDRKFLKVEDLLSNLGGFAEIILVIFG
jgi:hypothetical protein